jgi:hypothetical protein
MQPLGLKKRSQGALGGVAAIRVPEVDRRLVGRIEEESPEPRDRPP